MSTKYALAKSLRELRFHFCQQSNHSAAIRSFLSKEYPSLKKQYPDMPILIREARGTQPRLFARHGFGYETEHSLVDLDENHIAKTLTSLVEQPAASA